MPVGRENRPVPLLPELLRHLAEWENMCMCTRGYVCVCAHGWRARLCEFVHGQRAHKCVCMDMCMSLYVQTVLLLVHEHICMDTSGMCAQTRHMYVFMDTSGVCMDASGCTRTVLESVHGRLLCMHRQRAHIWGVLMDTSGVCMDKGHMCVSCLVCA